MAHFAEIDENNIVLRVVVVPDEEEERGHEFLSQDLGLGGTWLKTSYNTFMGSHVLGGTPYRINYAMPGGTYDSELDGFIFPRPYPSWTEMDPATGSWIPPVPLPEDASTKIYVWDETSGQWVLSENAATLLANL